MAVGRNDHLFITSYDKKKKDLQYSIGKINRTIGGGWTTPEIVHIPTINFSGDFTDFYITPDEKVLFTVLFRVIKGMAKKIYMSVIKVNKGGANLKM